MHRLTAGALGLALLFSACADGGSESSAEDNTAPSSTTSTTFDREAEEQAVIEAYLAEVEAFLAAADPPNPDDPRLAEVAEGAQLQGARDLLADLRAQGLSIKRSDKSVHRPRVVRLEISTAVIEDCVTDADVKVRTDTGEVVDESVAVGVFTAGLVRRAGVWRVSDSSFRAEPCVDH